MLAYSRDVLGNELMTEWRMERRVRWTQMIADILVYDDWSPYEKFTTTGFFPYFRRGQTQGMIESLLDPQREINKRRSARLNIIMRAANGGWIYDKKALDIQQRQNLQESGSKPGVHIVYDSNGGTIKAPEQIQAPTSPEAMRQLEHEAEDDLKKIANVNESALGQDSSAKSGRAIEAQQRQTVIGIDPYLQNFKVSKRLLGERRLELIQNFYTQPRVFRVIGDDGKPLTYAINQRAQATGQILNDVTIGRYSVEVDDTPLSATYLEAQFAEALMLREKGIPIPDDILIEMSSLGQKADIKQRLAIMRQAMGIPPDMPFAMGAPVPGQASITGAPAPGGPAGPTPAPIPGGPVAPSPQGGGGPAPVALTSANPQPSAAHPNRGVPELSPASAGRYGA